MQKSLIVLLAVCLISVHAFVRREAPAAETDVNYLENLQKQIGDLSKQVNDKFKETFNTEEVKKQLNEVIGNVNKAFDELKAKTTTAQKE